MKTGIFQTRAALEHFVRMHYRMLPAGRRSATISRNVGVSVDVVNRVLGKGLKCPNPCEGCRGHAR